MYISMFLPIFIINTEKQCTVTSVSESYLVRDKRLAVTRPIPKPFCLAYDPRCLYHCLHYLCLRPPVSRAFEGKDDACLQ